MFEEDDDDLYDHDTGGDYATDLSSQNRRATPGGLDFSAFGERVAAPETAAPRQAGPKLDFSNFGEKVTVPTDPPLPRSRPAAANQSAEPQQAPQPLSTEAAVPLPRPRPDIGPNPADENYAAPLEDAPFRSGGKALDKIWGSTGGMLTGEEAYGEHQKRVAAAEAELATARAEREAAEARIAGRSTNPEDAATADPRLMRRALTLAQRRESEAQKALTAAQNHAPSTQGELRNAAEIVIGGLASGGADMLRNARGLSEVTPSLTRLIDPEAERRYRQGQRQFTEGVDEAAKRVGAPDPAQAEDIGSQLISGATSMGMFMAGGLAARALGAPGAIGSAGLGAFQQGGQLLGEAETAIKVLDRRIAATKAQGLDATPLEAQRDTLLKTKYIAMFAGMGLGATEAIPVERFFNRLNQVTGGRVGAILANTTTQSMEEMLQEIGQQIGSNVVARVLYDEGRDIFKDVNQSAAVAGVLGGLMGMGAGAFAPVRTSDAQAALPDPLIPAPGASPIEQAFQNAPSPIEEVFRRAGEIAGAPAAQPLSPEVGGVPQSGTEDRGGAAEAGPQPKVSAIERRVLRKKGYTDEDIDAMNRAEITAELGEAAQQGVAAAEEEPSAEPASDIMAQVEDLKAGKRGAVWLPKATVEHLQSTGALDAATSAGTVLKDFDGNGGILIAKDAATARQARKDRTGGGDVQEIVGRLTGAGTGKPPGADTVVQQKDQQGNVTRESLVTDEQAAPTAQAFAEPGRDVDIKPGVEALIDRNDRVDAEADQAMAGLSEMFGGQPQAQQPGAKLDFSDQGVPVEGDGSKTSPVKINDPDDLSRVDEQVAANPTAAQKEAENYKMGHVRWPGLRRAISIETAKGGTRADKNGKWRVPNYPVRYGRIKGTKGADGQQLDIFVGDDATVPHAFILDQFDPQTGKFDEHKIWVGIRDAAEVARIYDSVFTDGSGPARRRAISQVPMKVLNAWAFDGRKKKPFVKAAQAEKQQTVRLYRGETAGRNEENGGYYTTDRAMAEGFGRIRYVDMPREDADFFKMPGMGGAIYDLTNYPAGPSGVNWREKSKFLDGNGTQKDAETAVTAAIDAAFDDGSEAAPIEQPKGDIIDAKESVHEAILNVGMSPSQVDEADINAAAEIVAETNTNPADAFQQVMAEQIEETADAEQQPVSGSVEVGAQGGQQEEGELVSGGGEAVEAQTGEDQAGGEDRADQAGGLDFSDQAERPGEDEQTGDAAEAEDAGVAEARFTVSGDLDKTPQKALDVLKAKVESGEVQFLTRSDGTERANIIWAKDGSFENRRHANDIISAHKIKGGIEIIRKGAGAEVMSYIRDDGAGFMGSTMPYGKVRQFLIAWGKNPTSPMQEESPAAEQAEPAVEHQAKAPDHIESGEKSTETRETGFVETAIDKPAERAKAMLRAGKDTRKAHGLLRKAERQIQVWKDWNERQKRLIASGKKWIPTDYYRNAQAISGSGTYWFRPTELFARAFESYIFDRLANEGDGYVSQYLVQGVEPDRFADGQGYKGNPYPAGDERAAINSAFDEFVRALQVTEGKHGEGSKIVGQDKEDWKTPAVEDVTPKKGWNTPIVEDITPVKPITTAEKKAQLEDEMAALDEATKAMESGEEKVNTAMVLAAKFATHLREGGEFGNILAARKMAREAGFEGDAKAVEEAMELAVVQLAREIAADRADPKANFTALVDLYSRQPKLGTRTSTSMRDQAFSTAIPLAYVASRLAGITPETTVFEPTAGNGALLIEATPEKVLADEINPARAQNLIGQGFYVSQADMSDPAASASVQREIRRRLKVDQADVVMVNPPFGAVRQEGESQVFDLSDIQQGYKTKEIDHAIALRSLGGMKDGGRAVLLLGGLNKQISTPEGRSDGYNGKAKREFFKALYDRYNVVDHFTVAGELYERQGAGWPVDVIVIDGRGKSSRKLPAVDVPRVLNSWDQLGGLLDGLPQRSDAEARAASERPADRGPDGGNGRVRGDGERVSEPVSEAGQSGDIQRGLVQRPLDDDAGEAGQRGQERAGRGESIRPDRPPDAEQRASGLADFDAAFDAALDETFGAQEAPKSSQDADFLRGQANAEKDGPDSTRRRGGSERERAGYDAAKSQRTTAEVAKSAAKNLAGSADDAMAGLVQMFGGGKTVGSGLNFDEETYAKAKPLFVQAAQKFIAFKDDMAELVRRMVGEMRDRFGLTRDALEKMRPYLRRFMEEVKSGVSALVAASAEKPAAQAASTKAAEKETDKQVAYKPASGSQGLGTLVPVNMRTSIAESLSDLEKRVGSLDTYVATELGYETDKGGVPYFEKDGKVEYPFAAEQIDALALAIDNMKRGKGFIIGDQTGIGKGRVNAGVIRWALKNGHIPIFTTAKPNLYGDIYRDLIDIGIEQQLGRTIRLLMTNGNQKVPLTEDGKVVLKTPDSKKHNADLNALNAGNFRDKYDLLLSTYNQAQTVKGSDTARRGLLTRLASSAVLAFDESHEAGGQGNKKKEGEIANRSEFAREMIAAAKGVFYSSATYAKRPDVMDLYAATDMAMAVEDPSDLGEAIAKGGVPMQQAVAAMLAKAGQYIRRERSFDGVTYDTVPVETDHEQYDGISQALALIQEFSVKMQKAAQKLDSEIKELAESMGHDNATGDAGASSTLFTSLMHNIINQMLLALKSGPVAKMAIEALKRGEKPVITLANTMGAMIDQYSAAEGINPGDVLDADFSVVLKRYLDRSRTVIIKKPFSKDPVERRYLSDEELGPDALDAYNKGLAHIQSLVLSDLPISPIDRIKQDLVDAGYRVGEITGRGSIIDYSGDQPLLQNRPGKETSITGRRNTIAAFNAGDLDVIVLNQAGSTGLSLHASEKFDDQRQRHMFIAQAEGNIDTHMQMLGRVHRTGQVIVPKYSQLVADIPAEKRPAAVLAKKMASLNANTTASRGGALTAKDVPDFINEYGDQVAAVIIADDLVLNHRLGNAVKIDPDSGRVTIEDAMRKVTGHIPLLPLSEQEELYERLEADYSALLEQKAAMGENALEAQTLDLKARPLERTEVVKRKAQSESPFAMPVYIEKTSIVRQGKPFTPDEVIRKVLTEIGATDIPDVLPYETVLQNLENPHSPWGGMAVENERNRRMEALTEFGDFQREQLDKIDKEKPDEIEKQRLKLNAVKDRWEIIHQMLRPGARIILKTSQGNITSIVTKVEQTGATANPLALSSWKATFALASAERQVTLPFSRLYENGKSSSDDMSAVEIQLVGWTQTPADTIKMFTSLQNGSREERYIATGNMLAAYDWLGMKGRIVNYTDEQGNLRQGVLTAKDFDLKKHYATKARPIRDPAEIVAWLKNNQHKIMWSDDEVVRLMLEYGRLHVSTEAAKRTGGKFYLDKPLTDLTGDFWKKGPVMTTDIGNVTDAKMVEIVQRLQKLGAVFVDQSEQGPPPTEKVEQPKAEPDDEARTSITRVSLTPKAAQSRAKLQAAVLAAIEQVAGPQAAQRTVTPDTINIRPGRDWNLKEGETVESVGYYSPKNERTGAFPLIAVALANNFDAVRTAYHEGWHAIEGVLLDTEIAVLRRETDRLRQFVMQQFPNEADMIARAEAEEIWAEAAALYARARTSDGLVGGIHIAVRRIFEKIMRLLARIRGDVRELGFFEAQDIFEAFRSGEFGKAREQMPADMRRRWWNDEGALATSTRRRAARPGDVIPPPERVGANWAASLGRPWKERVSDAIDALLLKPARGIWDEQIDLLRFQKAAALVDGSAVSESLDTYLAAGLYPGKVGERMKDAQRDLWRPIFEAMRDRKVGRDELHEYLYARHAPERNAAIREIDPANDAGSGMSDDEAQQIMDAIDGSGRMADFVAVAEFIDRVVQANRDTIRREGLETDETMDAWAEKYDHYVPLKGWENGAEDELAMPSPSGGQGFATRGPESRRALGRFDRADDILANLFDQTQRTVVRAEKNRVAKTFLRFAREYPSPYYKIGLLETHRQINPLTGLVETYTVNASPNRDEVFAAKVGGRTYFIEIRHPGLLNALKSLGLTRLNPVLRLMRRLTREYSRFQTSKNPEFILVSNFERDIIDAAINISAEQRERFIRRFWANLPRAMGGSILGVTETGASRHARQMFEEWREAGGKISSYGLRDLEDISREMQRELNQRLESTTKTVLMTPLRFVNPFEGRFVKFLEAIADVMESTTRLAVYMAGRDIGLTRAQAANMGRNATVDFNKRGSAGHIFNALYSFSGANIQGNVNTLRRLRKSSTMRRAMGALMIAGYLMTLWNMSVSPEDEDKKRGYEKRKYWERERYIYIYMPGMKRPIKYNMPFVIKPFWMAGEQAAMAHLGKVGVGEAIGNVLGTTVSAFNPLGSQGSLFDLNSWTRGLFPTVLRPIPELSLNQNWTGNKIHPDTMPWTQHLPRSDRHKALTHPAAVNVAEFLNRVTGGNKFEPGWASLYPDDIQYGWDFALGGLGRFLNNTSGTIKDYVDGVDRPAERLPFVRNIIGSDNSAPSQDDYYKQRTETAAKGQRLRAAIRARAEGTDDGSADEVIERLARETGARASRNGRGVSVPGETVFRQADTQIKRLRQEETEIRNNKKLSSEERRVKILGLREQMRDIMRNARGSVPAP